ncbi:hypothetical protein [Halocola ammonii]
MNQSAKELKSYLSKLSVPEDGEMVLAALYYVHNEMGRETIAASELNKLLGEANLAFKDIHRILHELKEATPSLAEEVSQSGEFPPEDVRYRITDEGSIRARQTIKN